MFRVMEMRFEKPDNFDFVSLAAGYTMTVKDEQSSVCEEEPIYL